MQTTLYRLHARSGLIRAKVFGAEKAKGQVLTFLDRLCAATITCAHWRSHCECGYTWLEPLLERISQDRRDVVTPVIDTIDKSTFEIAGSEVVLTRGTFSWSLTFTWTEFDHHIINHRSFTASQPAARGSRQARDAHRAGLVCVCCHPPLKLAAGVADHGGRPVLDRQGWCTAAWQIDIDGAQGYFFEIGSYDMGMDVWGACATPSYFLAHAAQAGRTSRARSASGSAAFAWPLPRRRVTAAGHAGGDPVLARWPRVPRPPSIPLPQRRDGHHRQVRAAVALRVGHRPGT